MRGATCSSNIVFISRGTPAEVQGTLAEADAEARRVPADWKNDGTLGEIRLLAFDGVIVRRPLEATPDVSSDASSRTSARPTHWHRLGRHVIGRGPRPP